MADESFQEKTEKATPRRRAEARKKGDILRSTEVNSAIVLITGMMALRIFGNDVFSKLIYKMKWVFIRVSAMELTPENTPDLVLAGITFFGSMIAPIVLVIMIAGLGANLVQGGLVFAGESVKPKFNRISPAKGLKRIFSMRSLVELAKGLMKVLIVGTIGYLTLKSELNVYPFLMDKDVSQIVAFVGTMSFKLAIRVSLVLLILAVFDYFYQKIEFEKKLRMTKQEVKEEFKRTEGDPLIKSRIRSIQMKQARQRMLNEVPEADVVVTNPVHLAVALKYDVKKMAAPILVARGARLLAEKIKEIAIEHGVPVVENKMLARMLYRTTEVGSAIPLELYKAVAEILAYVYRLKGGRK